MRATSPDLCDSTRRRMCRGVLAQETCIIVPRAKVCFDAGRCPQRSVFQQTVLISHGHLDHIGGVPFHVSSRWVTQVALVMAGASTRTVAWRIGTDHSVPMVSQ